MAAPITELCCIHGRCLRQDRSTRHNEPRPESKLKRYVLLECRVFLHSNGKRLTVHPFLLPQSDYWVAASSTELYPTWCSRVLSRTPHYDQLSLLQAIRTWRLGLRGSFQFTWLSFRTWLSRNRNLPQWGGTWLWFEASFDITDWLFLFIFPIPSAFFIIVFAVFIFPIPKFIVAGDPFLAVFIFRFALCF